MMRERDNTKKDAICTGDNTTWQAYRTIRNNTIYYHTIELKLPKLPGMSLYGDYRSQLYFGGSSVTLSKNEVFYRCVLV